jgi:hypothetical protein
VLQPWIDADRYYLPGGPACIDEPEDCNYYTPGAWWYSVVSSLPGRIEGRVEEIQRQLDGGAACSPSCEE